MEEQAQKRNTDCLYFLASPLTCKKGIDCEYRHSDSARLNPRDCWYWLSGSCRNSNCAFRHPPLERFNGVIVDSFNAPSLSVAPTRKLNVLCYFHFNAICAKGEQCPYFHGTFPAQKVSRPVPEAAANNLLQNKISNGDTGPAPSVPLPANPSPESLGLIKMNSNLEVSQQAVPRCAPEECSPSAESMVPECEEPVENPAPSVELMDRNGQLSPYLSLEELAKEFVEQELDERWESSPGFDVLVDGVSELLTYEDVIDYQLTKNGETESLHSHLLECDFDGSACCDHISYPYEELHQEYDHMDDIHAADYFLHSYNLPREEIIFEPMLRVHELHDRDNSVDILKEHQKKHSRMNARWQPPLYSRKRRRPHAHTGSQGRATRRGINGSVHHRLASQVGRCMIVSSKSEEEYTCKDHDRQGWQSRSGTGKFTQPRFRAREKRRYKNHRVSPEVPRQNSALDAEKAAKSSSNGFAGPKTLAQIKEEKSRYEADLINSQDFLPPLRWRQATTAAFEGPKPLDQLLNDKRRSGKNVWANLEHVDVSCQVKNRTSDAETGKQGREFVNGYRMMM